VIKVYQAADICPAFHPDRIVQYVKDNFLTYHHVATVDTNDPNEAYELTQTITQRWWFNKKIQFHGSKDWGMRSCRSTAIGDVLVLENGAMVAVASYDFVAVKIS
jgi:hypothetical protein